MDGATAVPMIEAADGNVRETACDGALIVAREFRKVSI
jgi:hypothetical protein